MLDFKSTVEINTTCLAIHYIARNQIALFKRKIKFGDTKTFPHNGACQYCNIDTPGGAGHSYQRWSKIWIGNQSFVLCRTCYMNSQKAHVSVKNGDVCIVKNGKPAPKSQTIKPTKFCIGWLDNKIYRSPSETFDLTMRSIKTKTNKRRKHVKIISAQKRHRTDNTDIDRHWRSGDIFCAASEVHGIGAWTKTELKRGDIIGMYGCDCQLITQKQVNNIKPDRQDFLLKLENGMFVNAESSKHFAAKINHKFLGINGANVEYDTSGLIHVLRDIKGTPEKPVELFVDYGYSYWADKLLGIEYDTLSDIDILLVRIRIRESLNKQV